MCGMAKIQSIITTLFDRISNNTSETVYMLSHDELTPKKAGPIEDITPFHNTGRGSVSL